MLGRCRARHELEQRAVPIDVIANDWIVVARREPGQPSSRKTLSPPAAVLSSATVNDWRRRSVFACARRSAGSWPRLERFRRIRPLCHRRSYRGRWCEQRLPCSV